MDKEAAMHYWNKNSPYASTWTSVRCFYSLHLGRWVYMGWDKIKQKVSYLYEKSRNHWAQLAGRPTDLNLLPPKDNGADRPQVKAVEGEDKAEDVEVLEHILSNLIGVLIKKGYLVDGEVQRFSYAHVRRATNEHGQDMEIVAPFPYAVTQ